MTISLIFIWRANWFPPIIIKPTCLIHWCHCCLWWFFNRREEICFRIPTFGRKIYCSLFFEFYRSDLRVIYLTYWWFLILKLIFNGRDIRDYFILFFWEWCMRISRLEWGVHWSIRHFLYEVIRNRNSLIVILLFIRSLACSWQRRKSWIIPRIVWISLTCLVFLFLLLLLRHAKYGFSHTLPKVR